ncbi:MAG: 4-hydroxythreonine-4-phosphate dehydrogenase PdxA [Candidatus Omnitrophica bacterium]|nr:4-hydroxythreonine-4-phosphate dehydrogenase PdxA [Candidatus Omnitrophota bacterium]
MGDPAGIGPGIILNALRDIRTGDGVLYVVIGDRDVFNGLAGPGVLREVSPEDAAAFRFPGSGISLVDPGGALEGNVFGKPTEKGAAKSLSCIDTAVDLVKRTPEGIKSAIVTAPVSKEAVAAVCPGFVGHTEHLQKAFGAEKVTMVMVGEKLKVVPVTRHIPLKDVPGSLTPELIVDTIRQVVADRYIVSGAEDPSIAVCALNPHCGEGGRIGREELDIIGPAVAAAARDYPRIKGPVSADVVFYKALKGEVDIVLSMYHDQCLSPFKMVDFDRGVNMTLGLGHVRTSPDHGTAFDIAGKGIADHGSMLAAIKLALRAVEN